MKHFFISASLFIMCCSSFAQTKKADSSRKNIPLSNNSSPLKQQKIWPVNSTALRNKDSFIINNAPSVKTRTRL
jgi:hypothetical protein